MAIMIEVLNKQHKVIERHKFSGGRVTLGRAFDNALILFDKHVSPHHAELVQTEDGQWCLHDLASLNGSFVALGSPIQQASPLQSGQLCWLGEQAIRVYDENHPVPAALPFNAVEQKLSKLGHWGILCALMLVLVLAEVFSIWLSVPKQERNEWPRMLLSLPLMFLALALWPAALAVWARINQHEPRFFAQIGITFAFVGIGYVLDSIFAVLTFSANGSEALVWFRDGLQWLAIVGMLFANFYLALQISTLRKAILACTFGAVFVLQSLDTGLFNHDFHQMTPQYDSSLMPLSFYFNAPVSDAEFQQSSAQLFQRVSEQRQEDLQKAQ